MNHLAIPSLRPVLATASFAAALLATALLALGCDGQPAGGCSADDECGAGEYCVGPDDPNVCGIPPQEFCANDGDCGPDERCHAVPDPCSPDGVGSECRPACRPGNCFEGFRCTAEGACEAESCADGYTCPDHQQCAPDADPQLPVHARTHGCADIPCGADGDCPAGGSCIDGICHSGPGYCAEPMLVP